MAALFPSIQAVLKTSKPPGSWNREACCVCHYAMGISVDMLLGQKPKDRHATQVLLLLAETKVVLPFKLNSPCWALQELHMGTMYSPETLLL